MEITRSRVYHIGSTSIDTIYAKPIIDLLSEVKDIEKVDPLNTEIEAIEDYMDGKAEFIKETDKKAAEWRRAMLR